MVRQEPLLAQSKATQRAQVEKSILIMIGAMNYMIYMINPALQPTASKYEIPCETPLRDVGQHTLSPAWRDCNPNHSAVGNSINCNILCCINDKWPRDACRMDDTFMDVFLALHNFLKDAGKLMAARFKL